MAESLVTIATFNEPTEAHILKGRLEAEGILCFLGDEHIIGAYPLYAMAVGGIKLKVTENDVDEAKTILRRIWQGNTLFDYDTLDEMAPPEGEAEIAKAIVCPRCGSDQTQEKPYFLQAFLGPKYECRSCMHRWKP